MPGAPDPVQYTSRAAGCPADGTACALTLDIVISTITQRVVREAVRRRTLPNKRHHAAARRETGSPAARCHYCRCQTQGVLACQCLSPRALSSPSSGRLLGGAEAAGGAVTTALSDRRHDS